MRGFQALGPRLGLEPSACTSSYGRGDRLLLVFRRNHTQRALKFTPLQKRGSKRLSQTPCITSQLATATKQAAPATSEKHLLKGAAGSQVAATVQKGQGTYRLVLSVQPESRFAEDTSIVWGFHRSSTGKWYIPDAVKCSAASKRDSRSGGMRSELKASANGGVQLSFDIPAQLAPLFLAFELQIGGRAELNRSGQRFAVPVGMSAGKITRMGASLRQVTGQTTAVDFVVRSRGAAAVSLLLARAPKQDSGQQGKPSGCLEIALDPDVNRTGDLWHICVEGLKDLHTLCYAWRADAEVAWEGGGRFYPGQVMFDPYAAALVPVQLQEGYNVVPPREGQNGAPYTNNPPALTGNLSSLLEDFDFGSSQRPGTPLDQSILLEIDVASFTRNEAAQDEVPLGHQGKFLGLLDRLKAIKATGATGCLLTPVYASAPGFGQLGRAPISFFAPDNSYAVGQEPGAAARELKQVIRGFHEAGLEIILQVEYCFTGEGSDAVPAPTSLRGLDAGIYYRTGSLLNAGHGAVRTLVLDSLRHWAREYDVDGFCFVNAENMVQDRDGTVLDNPPLPEEISADPLLGALKLIAWSGNNALLPRSGTRGFPHWGVWLERNARFSADLAPFVAGLPATASGMATRLTGSADLFDAASETGLPGGLAAGRRPAYGLNGASYFGKGTLWDLVASSVPWDVQPPAEGKLSAHETLAKTMFLLLLASPGIPTLPQDVMEDDRHLNTLTQCLVFRKAYAAQLTPRSFDPATAVQWHGAAPGSLPDWEGTRHTHDMLYMGYSIPDVEEHSVLYIGMNPHHYTITLALPEPPQGGCWKRIVDTSFPAPDDFLLEPEAGITMHGTYYDIPAKATVAFRAKGIKVQPAAAQSAAAKVPRAAAGPLTAGPTVQSPVAP